MKHNFYANNRTHGALDRQISAMRNAGFRTPFRSSDTKRKMTIKPDQFVSTKVNAAIKAYSDNLTVQSEIATKARLYAINLTIARQYKDKKAEKDLTKEILGYLDQKIREKR